MSSKRLEINILTRHKLPDTPSPAKSNGRPLNFVVNVCYVCGFAWGVFRDVLGEIALTMYSSTSIGHARHVKTRNDHGLRIWIFSQKLPFSVGKKCFKDKFRKYNTLYLYVI